MVLNGKKNVGLKESNVFHFSIFQCDLTSQNAPFIDKVMTIMPTVALLVRTPLRQEMQIISHSHTITQSHNHSVTDQS